MTIRLSKTKVYYTLVLGLGRASAGVCPTRAAASRGSPTATAGSSTAAHMLIAASEIAANAAEHGGGIVDVRVGPAMGRFVCENVDRGSGFDDPAAGYLPLPKGLGSGLWVAQQLTWRIEILRSPRGFTARIWL